MLKQNTKTSLRMVFYLGSGMMVLRIPLGLDLVLCVGLGACV